MLLKVACDYALCFIGNKQLQVIAFIITILIGSIIYCNSVITDKIYDIIL